MSAIADFSVAVLDCPTCCGRFIENHVAVAMHRDRIACPHCGAHYISPTQRDELAAMHGERPSRHAHNRLHQLAQYRRKLQ